MARNELQGSRRGMPLAVHDSVFEESDMGKWKGASLILVACAVIPGCGGGGGGGGATVILGESFDAFPNASWSTSGSATASGGVLVMSAPSVDAVAQTTGTCSTASGLTVNVQMGVPGFVSGQTGVGVIDLDDPAVPATDAKVELDLVAGTLTFDIMASSLTVPVTMDTLMHTYTFHVTAAGVATWARDGVVQLSAGGFPVSGLRLELVAQAPATATFNFDNVTITTP